MSEHKEIVLLGGPLSGMHRMVYPMQYVELILNPVMPEAMAAKFKDGSIDPYLQVTYRYVRGGRLANGKFEIFVYDPNKTRYSDG